MIAQGFCVASAAKIASGLASIAGLICADSDCTNEAYAINRAIDSVGQFITSHKHLMGSGGNWVKFSTNQIGTVQMLVRETLANANTLITSQSDGRIQVIADLGREIGTRGQTGVKVVIDAVGRIITSYPVNIP